jgi:pyruvate dehydrogenase E2 component (dihydrolipoamide acetyltransferase)
MAVPITVPRLGWDMDEGTFLGWLAEDGAAVRAGQALFRLEGAKATEDVECLEDGVLRIAPDGPRTGDTVAVGAVIGHVARPGEVVTVHGTASHPLTPGPSPPGRGRGEQEGRAAAISPRARRAARQLGVDWSGLRGSGRSGRIRERDVRAAASVPRPATRKVIAERMLASHRSTAPVTLTTTADATNLVNLRGQFREAGQGPVPTYTDFLVKLTAAALEAHPTLNARWDGEQVVPSAGTHIGVAVDTDAGLLVPVLRDVPRLTLRQVAALARELIDRARRGRLTADEMAGGTFTLTNLGALGVEAFTPLINLPQCAVLGVGRIQPRPAVVGGQVVPREQVTLSLTFDHRVIDGAPAARFLQALGALVENPGPALMP